MGFFLPIAIFYTSFSELRHKKIFMDQLGIFCQFLAIFEKNIPQPFQDNTTFWTLLGKYKISCSIQFLLRTSLFGNVSESFWTSFWLTNFHLKGVKWKTIVITYTLRNWKKLFKNLAFNFYILKKNLIAYLWSWVDS